MMGGSGWAVVQLALLDLVVHVTTQSSWAFATDLERCIRTHATEAATTFPQWGKSCMPPTAKIDIQASIYEKTLAPIEAKWGYTGALWCAFYSLRMTGAEYDAKSDQPNNPNFGDWHRSLLCPWNITVCGQETLGSHGHEKNGVPAAWGEELLNAQYLTNPDDQFVPAEPKRRTMSCGLCGHLERQLGKPPFIVDPEPVDDPGAEHLYTSNWDFHAFGAWLANEDARHGRAWQPTVENINIWRASNGEEIHGYLWQSTRLHAYTTRTLAGERKRWVGDALAVNHVMRVCEPSWSLAPQSRDDCSHAAGHGFFYYYLDVGRAVSACWSDMIIDHTPCGSKPAGVCLTNTSDPKYDPTCWYRDCSGRRDVDTDTDTRSGGLNSGDLLKWRWLCATGVYHAAGNTLSVQALSQIAAAGFTAEGWLCKRSNLWGENARYFDRCAAGLGIAETEVRLGLVTSGACPADPTKEMAAWEVLQHRQFGQTQQLSCNPAKYFVQANDMCPLAFRAHFPCVKHSKDYEFCISGYHDLCTSHDLLRETFGCAHPHTPPAGTNEVKYAGEPGTPWHMGTPLGV